MQGRLSMLELLVLESAAVATLSALGMLDWHLIFKPLTMVIAIFFAAARAISTGAICRFDALLLAALVFSLGGDVFLMLPGDTPIWGLPPFILGLGSFLVAHLFYITLLRQGQAWFPNRRALVTVLAFGAAMYVTVWNGLGDPVLKIAVATYVTVISLMAAQAIGRATVLRDSASQWVAVGACIFMVSDSLIAINKFVTPVALSSLWILVTYYAAQMLIMHNAVPKPRTAL
jgi:alkylglycerol monooxygenase